MHERDRAADTELDRFVQRMCAAPELERLKDGEKGQLEPLLRCWIDAVLFF